MDPDVSPFILYMSWANHAKVSAVLNLSNFTALFGSNTMLHALVEAQGSAAAGCSVEFARNFCVRPVQMRVLTEAVNSGIPDALADVDDTDWRFYYEKDVPNAYGPRKSGPSGHTIALADALMLPHGSLSAWRASADPVLYE